MKTMTKALAKASVTTIAAGAMAMTSVAPAYARDRHNNGIDAGDVIAGAVILGGIAAVLSAGKNRNDGRYDNRDYRYHDRNYRPAYDGHRGNGERAVQMCINAVERDARRAGYRFADVTQIRDVDRDRNGWEVRGRLVVDEGRTYRGDRYGYDRNRYDRGNRYDRRYDEGRFTCDIRRGRIVDIDYSGIRGLR